jgi:hypothetical protein
MGTDYRLFNHSDATYYVLGKVSWPIWDYIHVMYDAGTFFELLKTRWNNFGGECKEEYFHLLSNDLEKFVKNTPRNSIVIYGDSGDEIIYARILKYTCVGSRYCLGDPKANKEYIDDENQLTITWDITHLTDTEKKVMQTAGWNFKNVGT